MPLRVSGVSVLVALALAACATTVDSPQDADERQAQIESILTQASEFSETERCLNPSQFRNIEILSNRYLLFEGRGDNMWLNTLLHRCPGLHRHSVLGMERMSVSGSYCRLDSFEVYDRMDAPWYRRWPWQWGGGTRCSLGDFQPVNEVQVESLKAALKPR